MGTNYFWLKEPLEEGVCADDCGLHIGKNSWGWVFQFEAHEDLNLMTTQNYRDFLREGYIYDEYDDEILYEEFWEMLEETKEPMPDGREKYVLCNTDEPSEISSYFLDRMWEDEGFAFANYEFV